MGHTIPPFTHQFRREARCFNEMRRGLLLKHDQQLFKEIWQKAEFHIPAAEKAAHPLPIVSILFSVDLEQEKSIYQLKEQIKSQQQTITRLQETNHSQAVDILLLKGELEFIQRDVEKRLKVFREEMLEIKYDLNS